MTTSKKLLQEAEQIVNAITLQQSDDWCSDKLIEASKVLYDLETVILRERYEANKTGWKEGWKEAFNSEKKDEANVIGKYYNTGYEDGYNKAKEDFKEGKFEKS